MKRARILFILVLFAKICLSQVTLVKSFYINGQDQGNRVIQTSDGNYVICGTTSNGVQSFLLKVTGNGDSLWVKEFRGGYYPWTINHQLLEETQDSGLIFTSVFSDKLVLLKTNKNGDSLWAVTVPGINYGTAQLTRDGGFIICGNDTAGVCLLKTNNSGQEQWRTHIFKVTEINLYPREFKIIQTTDNGYLVSINAYYEPWDPPVSIAKYAILVKTNNTGDSLWIKKSHFIPKYQIISDLLQAGNGSYITAGGLDSVSTYNRTHVNGYLVNLNEAGDTLWSKSIGGEGNQAFYSIEQTYDGGFIACGTNNPDTIQEPSPRYGFYLVRMNVGGDTLWTKNYTGPSDIIGLSVHETSDHGFIACGINYNASPQSSVYLINTDANGDVFPEGTNDKHPTALLTPFPNPTQGKVYLNPPGKFKTLEVTDILGNVVLRRNLDPDNNNTITTDLTGNSKGVYFLQLKNETSIRTGKILLK